MDKIILASFGIRVNEKLVQAIKAGQQLNGTATGEQVAGVIIKYLGQHLNEAFKKKMYDQFNNITKEHMENFHAHGQLLESTKHINQVVDLHSIKAQTLIINGEMDTVMDSDDIALAASQIANCVVKIVPGVGHFLHNESDDVLGIYRAFLSIPPECQLGSGRLDKSVGDKAVAPADRDLIYVDVSGEHVADHEAELRVVLAKP